MKNLLVVLVIVFGFVSCTDSKEYEQRLSEAINRLSAVEKHASRIADQTNLYLDNAIDGREDSESSKIAKEICVISSESAEKVVDSLDADISFLKERRADDSSFDDFVSLYTETKAYLDAVRTTKDKSAHDYRTDSRVKHENVRNAIERFKLKYVHK